MLVCVGLSSVRSEIEREETEPQLEILLFCVHFLFVKMCKIIRLQSSKPVGMCRVGHTLLTSNLNLYC